MKIRENKTEPDRTMLGPAKTVSDHMSLNQAVPSGHVYLYISDAPA